MTTVSELMGSGVPAQQAQNTVAGVPLQAQTAAGTTQANAYAVTNDFIVFTTVGAGTGARLPAQNAISMTAIAGDIYRMANAQATNALLVYPAVGGNFVGLAANASVSVPAGKSAEFWCCGNNVWVPCVSA